MSLALLKATDHTVAFFYLFFIHQETIDRVIQLTCPLCYTQANHFFQDKRRNLYHCEHCLLIFADPNSYLLPHIAQIRYQQNRHKRKKSFQAFITSAIDEVAALSQAPISVLSFGRVMSNKKLLNQIKKQGHKLTQYEPYNTASHTLSSSQYDLICCYRVLEHFHKPRVETQRLATLMKPGGWLAICSPLLTQVDNFSQWHHKNNVTHVSFYQIETIEFLAKQLGFKLLLATNDLILMQKPTESAIKRDLS